MKVVHKDGTAIVPRILLVDDEPFALKALQRFFRPHGHTVITAENAEQGLKLLRENPLIQLVISDYKMPGNNGIIFLNDVSRIRPDIRRVILSAFDDSSILLAAVNERGVHHYLVKPWDSTELLAVVEEQLAEFQRDEQDRLYVLELAGRHHMLAVSNQQLDALIAERTEELMERERDLNEANERLRLLTGHLETSREEERRAIAREIHDDLAQSLTAIQLTIAPHLHAAVETAPKVLLERVKGQVDNAITTVQRILSNLRPQVLDELGLEAALDWLAKDFAVRYGTKCRFTPSLMTPPVPAAFATCLYRITQESLTNVGRHADATSVDIRLQHGHDSISIEIQDNGIGIKVSRPVKECTFGITGMQERAALCGGTCTIVSSGGNGTLVTH